MDIVIASANRGKVDEIVQIMHGLPVRLVTKDEVQHWPQVEETGTTYLDNARLKARALLAATGMAALADDSGIEVDALYGAPGVRSARFAGPNATDEANNIRLVSLLHGVPAERRTARYVCVVVLAMPGGEELSEIGFCEGSIALNPKGEEGFGYDPWFLPAGYTRTMAQLTAEEKNEISHRGKAFRALRAELETRLPSS